MKVHNFYAGPAVLPAPALERAHKEFFNFAGTGMSVMEISHRSKPYSALNEEAQNLMRELLDIPSNYKILFLQGGATLQFGMVPMNFLTKDKSADYVITGAWSEKALSEAKLFGKTKISATTKETNFNRIPKQNELVLDTNAEYLHITTNNTIFGTQWHYIPEVGNTPLIADMSSDMMWKKFDVSKYGLIYGGAQKNMGPSGVVIVIIRDDLLAKGNTNLAKYLSYATHIEKDPKTNKDITSLYNTPPTFGVYMLRNVLAWQKDLGGLAEVEKRNHAKAKLIYDIIDNYSNMYKGHAEKDSRSVMNITFNLLTKELEQKFIQGAEELNIVGLPGHKSVGGCRASTYNALPYESVEFLAQYMIKFAKNN